MLNLSYTGNLPMSFKKITIDYDSTNITENKMH